MSASLKFFLFTLLVAFLFVVGGRSQSVPSSFKSADRYVVLAARNVSDLEKGLARAASDGYHVVAFASNMKGDYASGWTAILERNVSGVGNYDYQILDNQQIGLSERVNKLATSGFRVVPRGAFEQMGHDYGRDYTHTLSEGFWDHVLHGPDYIDKSDHTKFDTYRKYVLMEKRADAEDLHCRYSLVRPYHTAALENASHGINLVAVAEGSMWLFENCVTPFKDDPTPFVPLSIRTALLSGDPFMDQKKLDEAVADGFRISYAAGPQLTLEKSGSQVTSLEYRPFADKSATELQEQLNSRDHFRLIPGSLWLKRSSWSSSKLFGLVERIGGSTNAYRYKVLHKGTGENLQKALNQEAAKGYEVRDMVRDSTSVHVILEASN